MPERSGLVTLLTDFGLKDPFVGILHGVIAARGAQLRAIDLTHQVPPQAVGVGAFYLRHAFGWFPEGTVHVAVVDPGVGTERHALALETLGHVFVAPDNGLLGDVLQLAAERGARVRSHRIDGATARLGLTLASATFHGRDVFAPVGAELALGLDVAEVGPELAELRPSPNSSVKRSGAGFEGQVVAVDHFGNCITNLYVQELCPEAAQQPERYQVWVEQRSLPLVRTYSDVAAGELCALVSSFGSVEIAARNASAVRQSPGLALGSAVRLCPRGSALTAVGGGAA